MLLLQVTSFFWIVYLDSIFLPQGVIAFFFDEYWSSWTAWLGCVFIASLIYLEKAVIDAISLLKDVKPRATSKQNIKPIASVNKVQHRNSMDDKLRMEVNNIPVPHTMTKSGSTASMLLETK